MDQIKYLYSINPKKPIRTLPELGLLRSRKTLELSKEQVLEILKYASVYRRFDSNTIERVSISNLDRLHNDKLMAEDQYKKFLSDQNDHRGKSIVNLADKVVEEVTIKEEPAKAIEEEFNVESSNEEVAATVEETIPEVEKVEEVATEVVEEAVVEESNNADIIIVEDNAEDTKSEAKVIKAAPVYSSSKTTVNYNGNKKKH
jgi:hypothetical protein